MYALHSRRLTVITNPLRIVNPVSVILADIYTRLPTHSFTRSLPHPPSSFALSSAMTDR